ncbi:hypothetical protein Tco_0968250 [Tanacetum coccineum]
MWLADDTFVEKEVEAYRTRCRANGNNHPVPGMSRDMILVFRDAERTTRYPEIPEELKWENPNYGLITKLPRTRSGDHDQYDGLVDRKLLQLRHVSNDCRTFPESRRERSNDPDCGEKFDWDSKRGPEYTWEREDHMKSKYPYLFVNRVVNGTS